MRLCIGFICARNYHRNQWCLPVILQQSVRQCHSRLLMFVIL